MACVVSVIVPVYNDPEGIATTLGALVKQTLPTEQYEIIVCDNGSSDGTRDIVRAFQCDNAGLIRLVVEDQQQGSYAARNKGITNASGEILAFVDADMWMGEDWLARMVDKTQHENMDYLGCNVEIVTTGKSAGALPPGAGGGERGALSDPQVPHDDPRGRGAAEPGGTA